LVTGPPALGYVGVGEGLVGVGEGLVGVGEGLGATTKMVIFDPG
jgi:hypothetical protein